MIRSIANGIAAVLFMGSLTAAAVPVVGEKVVYKGTAKLADGDYQITKSFEVLQYDILKRAFAVRISYEQFGDGAPLGGYDQDGLMSEKSFSNIEKGLIPMLKQVCGQILPQKDGSMVITALETIETGIGPIEACKLEPSADKDGKKHIAWFSEKTAPWAVQEVDVNVDGTETKVTLFSYFKPAPAKPKAPGATPATPAPVTPPSTNPDEPKMPPGNPEVPRIQ